MSLQARIYTDDNNSFFLTFIPVRLMENCPRVHRQSEEKPITPTIVFQLQWEEDKCKKIKSVKEIIIQSLENSKFK